MSELGDFLEALHDAPRATSFSGTARRGQDPEKIRQLLDEMNRRRGGGTHSVAILATSGPGSASPSGFQEAPIAFWYSAGNWRVDQGASRTIGAGGEVFRVHPGNFAVVTSRENLGPCAAEVRKGFPQYASAMLANREGRAVLIEGAWKVSRATYCSLIAMAGVVCPPPSSLNVRP